MHDYIIVGGGSAGGVLANRLTESGEDQVCLLESGPACNSALISTPGMFAGLIQDFKFNIYNWRFNTRPDASMYGRSQYQPRGRGLGGSSSINGMVYIRGDAADYDAWEAEGNKGWGYKDVLPYFKKAENNQRGECEYHGADGPLGVSDGAIDFDMYHSFLKSNLDMGYPYNADFNGAGQEGVGFYQFTVKDGKRAGVRAGYIAPAMQRDNLTVKTGAHVTKVLFEGKRAVGVEFVVDGKTQTLKARKEVILSGGAFNSPQLLLLSGVGPADELKQHGVEVQHDLPGVGKNLQEHPDIMLVYKNKQRTGVSLSPMGMVKNTGALANYVFNKKGWIANPPTAIGGFYKSDEAQELPNFQVFFIPMPYRDHARDLKMMTNWGFSFLINLSRPKSRGQVTLDSADPMAAPAIELNLLQDPEDLRQLRDAVKKIMKIVDNPAMDEYRQGLLQPANKLETDTDIEEFLRNEGAHAYHPVGSCKMGNCAMSVVDDRLRVHGLEGLRVVDCSIMPLLVGGNTNAPAIMIGEKAADMIKQDNRTEAMAH